MKAGTNCYPFGLTMSEISDNALETNYAENKKKLNEGTELQERDFFE